MGSAVPNFIYRELWAIIIRISRCAKIFFNASEKRIGVDGCPSPAPSPSFRFILLMIIFLKLASSYITNKRRAHKSYAPKAIVRNREKSGNPHHENYPVSALPKPKKPSDKDGISKYAGSSPVRASG